MLLPRLSLWTFCLHFSRGTAGTNPKGEDLETERFWRQGYSEPHNWDPSEDPSEAEEKNNQKTEEEIKKKVAKETDKKLEKETNKKTEERIAKKESKPEPEEEEVIEIKRVPERPSAGPLQLVHLDLKGAAPKVSYLKQVSKSYFLWIMP